MSNLREWLESTELQTERVEIDGHVFEARELSLARRGRLLSSLAGKDNDVIELALVAASIYDPDSGELVAPEPEFWQPKGARFSPLISAAVKVNGLASDPVEDEVKN